MSQLSESTINLDDVYQYRPDANCPECSSNGLSLFWGGKNRLVQFSCSNLHIFEVRYAPGATIPYARLLNDHIRSIEYAGAEPTQEELQATFAETAVYQNSQFFYPVTFLLPSK